jgi:acyl carrier protein phosphodiesterase
MNYLAHAYLSFNDEEILVGNMISDFVKGKKKFDYSPSILQGINLHRKIDEFTDNHAVTKEAKQMFKPAVGLYAGAFMDVVYDHFLSIDKNEFANNNVLQSFANNAYSQLLKYEEVFPETFKMMFPNMKKNDWLFNYQYNWAIERSFKGVVYRAKYLSDSSEAFTIFETNYLELQKYYAEFFPQLKQFTFNNLK